MRQYGGSILHVARHWKRGIGHCQATLLMNANSFVINPILRKLSYDPLSDFEPICYLARTPIFIVVGATSPYRTLIELFVARAKPAKPVCGAEFGAFLQTQRDQYFRMITEANIKGE
jgi:tripartite-type tricarboxylate transporter receptor subunit TctC